jgi:hypothetical protein
MSKPAIYILTGIFMLSLISCGGSGSKKTEEEKTVKKEGKTQEMLSIQIGDEKKTYEDVNIHFEGRAEQVSVSAFGQESKEGMQESIATLSFAGAKKGKMNNPSLSIDGYRVEELSGTVKSVKTGKSQYTRSITIESIKGTFQAKVKKEDKNGFPQGEPIDLKGSFEK